MCSVAMRLVGPGLGDGLMDEQSAEEAFRQGSWTNGGAGRRSRRWQTGGSTRLALRLAVSLAARAANPAANHIGQHSCGAQPGRALRMLSARLFDVMALEVRSRWEASFPAMACEPFSQSIRDES